MAQLKSLTVYTTKGTNYRSLHFNGPDPCYCSVPGEGRGRGGYQIRVPAFVCYGYWHEQLFTVSISGTVVHNPITEFEKETKGVL